MLQLYWLGDREWVAEKLLHVVAGGFKAFCLTVDTAAYSRRDRDIMLRENALVVTIGSSDSASTPSTRVASPVAGFAAAAGRVVGAAAGAWVGFAAGAVVGAAAAGAAVAGAGAAVVAAGTPGPHADRRLVPSPSSPATRMNARRLVVAPGAWCERDMAVQHTARGPLDGCSTGRLTAALRAGLCTSSAGLASRRQPAVAVRS